MDKSLPYELGAARSQLYSRGSVMDNKMLADSGYGQGQVLVTPLQLAAMFSAFANNGDMPTPRITDGLYITDGVEYKCIRKSEYSVWMEDAISTNAINKIIPMLQGVVDPNKTERVVRCVSRMLTLRQKRVRPKSAKTKPACIHGLPVFALTLCRRMSVL